MGVAVDSVVSAGSIVSGGRVVHSILSPGVRVNSYCEVEYSILMPGVEIGRYSRIRRAILNTGVKIPDSTVHLKDEEMCWAFGEATPNHWGLIQISSLSTNKVRLSSSLELKRNFWSGILSESSIKAVLKVSG